MEQFNLQEEIKTLENYFKKNDYTVKKLREMASLLLDETTEKGIKTKYIVQHFREKGYKSARKDKEEKNKQRKKAIELKEKGYTIEEINEELGTNYSRITFYVWTKGYEWGGNSNYSKFDNEIREYVKANHEIETRERMAMFLVVSINERTKRKSVARKYVIKKVKEIADELEKDRIEKRKNYKEETAYCKTREELDKWYKEQEIKPFSIEMLRVEKCKRFGRKNLPRERLIDLTEEQKEDIVYEYKNGKAVQTIGKEMNISNVAIRETIQANYRLRTMREAALVREQEKREKLNWLL